MLKRFSEERFASRVVFHIVVLVALFFALHIGGWLLAWNFRVRPEDLPSKDGAAFALLAACYFAIAVCGRVAAWHPAHNAEYRKWLRTTPWDVSVELPMSDVMVRWSDVVSILFAMSISFFFHPVVPLVIPVLVGLAHLLVMVSVFWRTDSRRDTCLFCFAAVFAVLLIPHWLWLIPLLIIAEPFKRLAHERCLAAFPWDNVEALRDKPKKSKSLLGFHYDGLRADIPTQEKSRTESCVAAVLVSLVCLAAMRICQVVDAGQNDLREGMMFAGMLPCVFLALSRLWQFKLDYRSPISCWGRLGTGRLLIPEHDRVYLVPLMLIGVGLLNVAAVRLLPLPSLWLAVGLGIAFWIYRTGKPSLIEWKLTGPVRLGTFSYEQKQNIASK